MNIPDKFHLYIRESVITSIGRETQRVDKELERQMSDLS